MIDLLESLSRMCFRVELSANVLIQFPQSKLTDQMQDRLGGEKLCRLFVTHALTWPVGERTR